MIASPIATLPLLDEAQLKSWHDLGLLDDYLSDYLTLIDPLLERIKAGIDMQNVDEIHQAMHSLLGVSGNIGSKALHQLIRYFYTQVTEGYLPKENDWFEQIKALTGKTVQTLETNYLRAKVE